MLSLSLFCSSQRISVALYDKRKLRNFFHKEITKTGVESIFKLVERCLKNENTKNLSNIFFSNGPGSFTALRSIKSIAEALSLSTSAKVLAVSSFAPLLLNQEGNYSNTIVCIKSLKGKSFFQLYTKKENFFSEKSILFHVDIQEVQNFYIKNKKQIKNLNLVTDDKNSLEMLNKKIKDVFVYPLSAKRIAEVCFLGYGSSKLDITYHSSYYENL